MTPRAAAPAVSRRACCAAGLGLVIGGARAQAATPTGAARIGLLLPDDIPLVGELSSALRELGWVEGRNLVIERRVVADPAGQRAAAAELQRLPVALILAPGTTAIRSARDGAPQTPIVMINAGDPVGSGLVASLARPGGRLTGTSASGAEVLVKQLELLHEAAPDARSVGVLMNRANPANDYFHAALAAAAPQLGLRLVRLEVASADDIEPVVRTARIESLLVLGDPLFVQEGQRLAGLERALRLPAMFGNRYYVMAGGLMAYNSSSVWHWRRAAWYVDRILKGEAPGTIPVEQPTQFELMLNLKTARAIGLALPQSLRLMADKVIE